MVVTFVWFYDLLIIYHAVSEYNKLEVLEGATTAGRSFI